jgi:hypothetical protein
MRTFSQRLDMIESRLAMISNQVHCRWGDFLHDHHDGCPSEWATEQENEKLKRDKQVFLQILMTCVDTDFVEDCAHWMERALKEHA